MTKRFVSDDAGRVKELHTWAKDDSGRIVPKDIPGIEKAWRSDLVLLTITASLKMPS